MEDRNFWKAVKVHLKKWWRSHLLGIVYTIFSLVQGQFSRNPDVAPINGCIMVVMMMLLAWQIIVTEGKLFWLAMIGGVAQFLQVSIFLLITGDTRSLPGALTAVADLIYLVITYIYVKHKRKSENELKTVAVTDRLTGLYNRFGFEKELESRMEVGRHFFLMFLDLDNFKYVNDTLGHDAGDEVLVKVSNLWATVSSYKYQCLARMGGDEFALILDTSHKKVATAVAKELLENINETEDPLLRNVTASIGIVEYPDDTKNKRDLLTYADSAMYEAKENGKGCYRFFTQEMHDRIIKDYETKEEVIKALKDKQFTMLYQPQYCTSEKLYGFESLIRLNVNGKQISTQYFIDVAERNNLIFDIDKYVLDQVTKDWAGTVRKFPNIIISANISGKHLIVPGFVDEVVSILSKNNFPPQNLCIEITEGAFVQSILLAKSTIGMLRTIGIKIALDDFGTKYSSLRYLQDFTTNHLKIEKSFTDTLIFDASDNNIVNIIINIAHLLNCEVIAEGVETEDQLKYLRDHGCDIIQGYYYSKPLELEYAKNCII